MRRILVVDDDLHTRLAIRAWLNQCGFRVAIVDGGPNGLATLRRTRKGWRLRTCYD
jgi:CheY-like chemotaxis protein